MYWNKSDLKEKRFEKMEKRCHIHNTGSSQSTTQSCSDNYNTVALNQTKPKILVKPQIKFSQRNSYTLAKIKSSPNLSLINSEQDSLDEFEIINQYPKKEKFKFVNEFSQKNVKEWISLVFVSLIISTLISSILIFILNLLCKYSIMESVTISLIHLVICTALLVKFKRYRTIVALIVPALISSKSGKFIMLTLCTLLILCYPVQNIRFHVNSLGNMAKCSTMHAENQTRLLLRPFESMMHRINSTMRQLHVATNDVKKSFTPLQNQLNIILHNNRKQNINIEIIQQNCNKVLDEMRKSCIDNMENAHLQCEAVTLELTNVYDQAKIVLDKINPNY
ncbi:hypothetical protein A3Q56_03976 [Intoshia linei]|uniref:Uncharacterized protein n=1 Tax=Intoshia linei TaxID=1819745 RepID=A0A177B1W8_9BILA|nr:hypothetical protein A3Q56_03976 [Intoshia linei]